MKIEEEEQMDWKSIERVVEVQWISAVDKDELDGVEDGVEDVRGVDGVKEDG